MNNDLKNQVAYRGLTINGFAALLLILVLFAAAAGAFMLEGAMIIPGIILGIVALISLGGFVMLEPNQAIVLLFFGKYRGTMSRTGFYWLNPFLTSRKVSLRVNNLDVAPIKVNDKVGNPVLIGMVLVWRVKDTYRVCFDLDTSHGQSAQGFVAVQSDAALREVAGRYPYDEENGAGDEQLTLRSGGAQINEELEAKLNERLAMIGVEVLEARLNYLAYAPEIAAVMLRRQQASAIISAREKIVEGAVSMVKMALTSLEKDDVVKLDNDRRAAMVGNLLLVLCGDDAATPVVDASL